MERFTGKVAVVTGSSYGIGRVIVKELVKRGLIVAGLARNVEHQQKLATEILTNPETYTGKFHPIKCDLMQETEIREAFNNIKTDIGSIAILINNAAYMGPYQTLLEQNNDTYQKIFDTNVKGSWLCMKEALQSMTDLPIVGHIININSIVSLHDFKAEFFPLYTASKDALRTISRVLRREILQNKQNIKVTDISPGATDTPMADNIKPSFTMLEEDLLQAEDVAKACISVLDTAPDVMVIIFINHYNMYEQNVEEKDEI
ncbi:hypothetical protein V9T40_003898 [Parthenolecanium corni]|uniref:Uncharacterized protein n=1 Tax=Parthenolecanium corni TaxID=536013 RepID=A0AAN9Y427_9HEMI